MNTKTKHAISIIRSCIGEKGVWASNNRYANQCWTRDFCIATCHLFLHNHLLENLTIVEVHLNNLMLKQRSNGSIPILFLDNEKEFLKNKISKSIQIGSVSFMLERYLNDKLEDLTPHTRDSEVLFVIAVCDYLLCYCQINGDTIKSNSHHHTYQLYNAAYKAINYIESNITINRLIHGADWRDVREDLNDKTVLTNACLLFQAYKLFSVVQMKFNGGIMWALTKEKAFYVSEYILQNFWNGTYFIDYPGTNNFDLLGNSLAVLFFLTNDDQKESIFNYAMTLSGPSGIKTTEIFLPPLNQKEKEVMERDSAVIWPFTNGFMLEAMLCSGMNKWIDVAKKEFIKWENLDGFHEWYDIVDGNGYGSADQVWSAALYLRVKDAIDKN